MKGGRQRGERGKRKEDGWGRKRVRQKRRGGETAEYRAMGGVRKGREERDGGMEKERRREEVADAIGEEGGARRRQRMKGEKEW